MIIADKHSSKTNYRKILSYAVAALAGLLVICYVIYQFAYPAYLKWKTATQPEVIYFDAEHVYKEHFISNGRLFGGAERQSEEEAHSGKYSYKVPATSEGLSFGLSGEFGEFTRGQTYRASVWFKSENFNDGTEAFLVISAKDVKDFYQASNEVSDFNPNNQWSQIAFDFTVPINFPNENLGYYVYTNGVGPVFFDDLKIEAIKNDSATVAKNREIFDPPHLHLSLSEKALKKITEKRDQAKKLGILVTDEDSWVKARLADKEKEVPVKIRLKGDWTDHLENDKWSFRVKVKDPDAWNRMIVFSLQTPAARWFVDEWVLHQFWEREDVLTTRYDFGLLSINNKALGVYAIEEHFDKQLLEFRSRREGPILRFVEDPLWKVRLQNLQAGVEEHFPAVAQLETADIQPFKEGRTAANPKLQQDFEIARTLLHQYQTGEKKASAIFDLERLAKFHAIADIMGCRHGLIWHNQRFYYNPVIGKLEPIGFDGYGYRPHDFPNMLGFSQFLFDRPEYVYTLKNLVEDPDFLEYYFRYFNQFSDYQYLRQFFSELEDGIRLRVDFIQKEFPDYTFDKAVVLQRAELSRAKLFPLDQYSVRAHWKKSANTTPSLEVRNLHDLPLLIYGSSTIPEKVMYPLEEKVKLPAYYLGFPMPSTELEVPVNAQYLFYQPYGIDTLFSTKISTWPATYSPVPTQELKREKPLVSGDWYEVKDQVVGFKPGLHTITKDILIPAGYQVFFPPGTQLDFQQGANFISYSPVFLRGTQENPVRIVSTDQSARGFTILQAPGKSEMSYAIFDNFNTLQDRGWQLTGAVTFYESDVDIRNCIFENNHCEDGLNLIRLKFQMEAVTVRNTPSDGFDADFCEGKIVNSNFVDTGNDGLDFSGSKIEIENCSMKNNGDKGISVGEDSHVLADRIVVENAIIAAASKDLSYLRVNHMTLKNCNQGFAAYQKKPEYGPSIIQIDDYLQEEIKYLYTIAPRCTMILEGHFFYGEL